MLGSPEARHILDAEGYDERALDITSTLPADRGERHGSLFTSSLDIIATYIRPSVLDSQRAWRETSVYQRRKLEVALAAWATLRHTAIPFAHAPPAASSPDEVTTPTDGDVFGVVEPHAEALAGLVALVRQARRGLAAHHAIHKDSNSLDLLEHVERLLDDALRIACAQASAPLPSSLARTLVSMPARIASIEHRVGGCGGPLVAVTAANTAKGRLLENATGFPSEVWLAVDVAGMASLFVGERIPFYEMAVTLRETDGSWAKRLIEVPTSPPAWVQKL
jgi:hypothetical protein